MIAVLVLCSIVVYVASNSACDILAGRFLESNEAKNYGNDANNIIFSYPTSDSYCTNSDFSLLDQDYNYLISKYGQEQVDSYISIFYRIFLEFHGRRPQCIVDKTYGILPDCIFDEISNYHSHVASLKPWVDFKSSAFIRDIIIVHRRLSVFWDEYGHFQASKIHEMMSVLVIRTFFHELTTAMRDNNLSFQMAQIAIKSTLSLSYVSQKNTLIDSHEISEIEINQLEDLLHISTQCLYDRLYIATPSVFKLRTEVVEFKQGQVLALSRVLSDLDRVSSDQVSNNEVISLIDAVMFSFVHAEISVTSTPATMMIGYEDHQLNDDILKMSRKALRKCLAFRSQSAYDYEIPTDSVVRKPKVAFVSSFFYRHSVGRLIQTVIHSIDISKYDLIVVDTSASGSGLSHDDIHSSLRSYVHRMHGTWLSLPFRTSEDIQSVYRVLKNSMDLDGINDDILNSMLWTLSDYTHTDFYPLAVRLLRALRIDIVVYPELGMHTPTANLAQFRYSKDTILFWGHPLSQQFDTIDYFVTSSLFEFHSHLSEKYGSRQEQVVLFDSFTTLLERPRMTLQQHQDDNPRIDVNINENVSIFSSQNLFDYFPRVYLLPHTVMKYSTEFDDVILSILHLDTTGAIVILYNEHQKQWYSIILERLSRRVNNDPSMDFNALQRLVALPTQNQQKYYNLLRQTHVVLDTFPFGMGVSALEAFAMNVPVVTLPQRQSVPSLVKGMMSLMGITDALCASSLEDYVIKSLQASGALDADDRKFRQRILDTILSSSKSLFVDSFLSLNQNVSTEWNLFMSGILSRSCE